MARNIVTELAKLRQLCANLEGSAKKLKTMAPRLQMIKQKVEAEVNKQGFMENIIKARFDKEAARSTGDRPWEPRKEAKSDAFSSHPILQKTGALLHSALRAVRNTYRFAARQTWFHIFSVNVHYGKFHQFGTPKMVARPFMLDPTPQELIPANRYAIKIFNKKLKELFK